MKKNLLIKILAFTLFISISASATAQKVGYVNSQFILSEMPAVKEMQSELETLRSQLQKQGQGMLEEYKKKEEDAINREQRGALSPIEKETVLKELQKKQEEILAFEKRMQDDLVKKEQELLEPILKDVNDAIQAVAKENGFELILETSILLYGKEELNVTNLVKAKLNL